MHNTEFNTEFDTDSIVKKWMDILDPPVDKNRNRHSVVGLNKMFIMNGMQIGKSMFSIGKVK